MENQNIDQKDLKQDDMWRQWEKEHKRGKIFGGILLVTAGSLFLAKELGVQIPAWVFTWKMLLIAIGVLTAIKHKFLHPMWIILVLIGGSFLLDDIYPGMSIKPLLWPVLIIAFGLFIIFKPRRKFHRWSQWQEKQHQWKQYHHGRGRGFGRHRRWEEYSCGQDSTSNEDYIDSTTFMGGVKKNILSKNFKGGDVVNVFGGAELNLMQADFENTATLDITNVFGGTKLLIPAHWEIKSELVSVCGSIEDKRPTQQGTAATGKTLVLRGTTFFGGIDIKSY